MNAHETATQKLSVVHGDASQPLVDLTLSGLLDFQCSRHAQRQCLVFPGTGARWSYARLRDESVVLANGLLRRGVLPGDRVAIMAGNCEQYAAVFFATMRIGAILVIINNTYTCTEARYALDFTGSRLFFTTKRIGHVDNTELLESLKQSNESDKIIMLRDDGDPWDTYAQLLDEGAQMADYRIPAVQALFGCHDVCNMQFTSGTTGTPKAAMLTHHSLVNNARFIGDRLGLTPSDILCCPPPMFHCFGLVLGMLAVISHGASIVFPSEIFNPQACLEAISNERCTALHGVPAMFNSIFELPRPANFVSRLRTGIIAGAPVPQYLMKLMEQDLGMTEFTSSYGLTEAAPTCFNALYTDPTDLKLTTVGRVMPHCHAKIVDRDGQIVPVGVRGEMCIAGYQLQRGYWNNPEKTAETMKRDEHGVLWLHTGDEAVIHENGTSTITGRFKELIIRGGENLYPLEIEERLMQHKTLIRAIVVGVRDAKYGETVGAFVERAEKSGSRPTDDEIRTFVREKLAYHKAPTHVFWLGEDGVPALVPLTGSGKVKKYEMARAADRLVHHERANL